MKPHEQLPNQTAEKEREKARARAKEKEKEKEKEKAKAKAKAKAKEKEKAKAKERVKAKAKANRYNWFDPAYGDQSRNRPNAWALRSALTKCQALSIQMFVLTKSVRTPPSAFSGLMQKYVLSRVNCMRSRWAAVS
jgi:hypothetical protein